MKGAAKLLIYFAAVVLCGALLAPFIYWAAQAAIAHGLLPFLGRFDFDTYFHRAVLVCAIIFLWPLLRSLQIRSVSDLQLQSNPYARSDLLAGILLAGIPLLIVAVALIRTGVFALKPSIPWGSVGTMLLAAAAVPIIEETLFRGLLFGVLLRDFRSLWATFFISAFYAIVHFLKSPDQSTTNVTWSSGLHSITQSFSQFSDPILLLAGFLTLFFIGWILADARLRTRSLWLPIGMHSGWILVSGLFGKVTKREMLILPWLGRNLLVGIIPVAVALCTWLILRVWLEYEDRRAS